MDQLKSSVKQDKIVIENQTVYFKSSEKMIELKDESIDLIITSPPYNRGKAYSSDYGDIHNDKMNESEYLSFLTSVWKECYRVAKKSAVFFLNIGDSANDQGKSEKVALSAEHAAWIRVQDIIWIKSFLGKGHYTPSGGNRRLNNIWEHVFLFVKDEKEYKLDPKAIGIPYADKSNIGRYSDSDSRDAGNVWLINYQKTTGATIKKGHDAPFPIGLPYKCIKLVPNTQIVLDPFGGTCTTLAACAKLSIKGYAYEKYPRIEVIKAKILEGLEFEEEKSNLIPHLELSIQKLSEMFSEFNFQLPKIKSKKDYNILKILVSSLEGLHINDPLKSFLEIRIKEFEQSVMNEIREKDKNKFQNITDYTK